ncbi:MAG: hypothetical protein WCO84_01575 [bacterium]
MRISKVTIDKAFLVSQQAFQMNRILDRIVSVLSVDFAASQASNILHLKYAHFYPAPLADFGNEILDMWNEKVDYLVTEENKAEYDNILEIFQKILDENLKLYDLVKDVIYTAFQEGDMNVFSHFLKYMDMLNKAIAQSILLRDKAVLMNDNVALFDFSFPSFFTFEV